VIGRRLARVLPALLALVLLGEVLGAASGLRQVIAPLPSAVVTGRPAARRRHQRAPARRIPELSGGMQQRVGQVGILIGIADQ
jgi:hypothetical protein